ncbi:MAG: chemotaxis protein CheX [Planctomycetota bacterium]
MDPSFIAPFVSSTKNVFSTMLQLPVEIGTPTLKESLDPPHDVTGVIGMTGQVSGSVILSMPMETAESIVAIFGGEKLEPESADFADAIGELVNMVSGGAKAQFPANGPVSISVPSVIVGRNHSVARQSGVPTVLIPCSTDCGDFVIEVAIRDDSGASVDATSNAASAGA